MAAMSNVVLNDAQATPVAHTFGPAGVSNNVAKWYDRSGGITLGYPQLTLSVSEATKARPTNKIRVQVIVPTLEVTSPSTASGIQPAPTLAYNSVVDLTMVFHIRSTLQERKNAVAYLSNFFANAAFTAAYQNFEPAW
ncbi:MAG: hypothetical protein [Sanya fiers-like virus 20]|nr:MAG: hypothetical protein [Sanya fiers-like virus 20]